MAQPKHVTVAGFPELLAALNKEINEIKGASMQGLIEAAILIRRSTEASPPLTPVDLGNLRASFTVVTAKEETVQGGGAFRNRTSTTKKTKGVTALGKDKNIASRMAADHTTIKAKYQVAAASAEAVGVKMLYLGYTAFYAWYVHENIGARFYRPEDKKHPGRQGAGARWFYEAVYSNYHNVLQIIAKNAKIK